MKSKKPQKTGLDWLHNPGTTIVVVWEGRRCCKTTLTILEEIKNSGGEEESHQYGKKG